MSKPYLMRDRIELTKELSHSDSLGVYYTVPHLTENNIHV